MPAQDTAIVTAGNSAPTKTTLLDLLTGGLEYSSSWAIYAEKANGEFSPDSPARIGQACFENGGMLDDCELFCDGEQLADAVRNYIFPDGESDWRTKWHADNPHVREPSEEYDDGEPCEGEGCSACHDAADTFEQEFLEEACLQLIGDVNEDYERDGY